MALRAIRPRAFLPSQQDHRFRQSRNFILPSLPSFLPPTFPTGPQTIRARRTLPYPSSQLYTLIADVDSYSSFLPYCTLSRVTAWTTAGAPHAPRLPTRADLTIGWGPFSDSYTSRLYCVPGSVVEAVSGRAETAIARDVLREYGYIFAEEEEEGRKRSTGEVGSGLFESLVTRWTVSPVATSAAAAVGGSSSSSPIEGRGQQQQPRTDVTLSIQYLFANPAYGLAVGKVADEVVGLMIEAFEKRAKELCYR